MRFLFCQNIVLTDWYHTGQSVEFKGTSVQSKTLSLSPKLNMLYFYIYIFTLEKGFFDSFICLNPISLIFLENISYNIINI